MKSDLNPDSDHAQPSPLLFVILIAVLLLAICMVGAVIVFVIL
jgi:hypothetical protein